MSESNLYTGYKICKGLKANEKCFRLHEYNEGEFHELFHEHIPKHRISADNAGEFMKTLVVRHSSLGDPEILRTYLKKRGKNPAAIEFGQVVIEYPEPGVLRKYFSCGNTSAWFDEVISTAQFRADSNG